jgi:hypothetical protein
MGESEGTRQFVNPIPPTQSTTPGIGVTRLASSVTAAKADLNAYPYMFNRRITLKNESTTAGDAIYVNFSATGATDVSAAATAGATPALGTTADQGLKILPGETIEVRLDRVAQRWIHWDALANTPVLCIYPSSQPAIY